MAGGRPAGAQLKGSGGARARAREGQVLVSACVPYVLFSCVCVRRVGGPRGWCARTHAPSSPSPPTHPPSIPPALPAPPRLRPVPPCPAPLRGPVQGISAVENICARPHVLNHLSIPAACFTHPEVSFVGVTQEKAEEMAKEGAGFPLGITKTSFKANSKVGGGRGPCKVHACMRARACACMYVYMYECGRVGFGGWGWVMAGTSFEANLKVADGVGGPARGRAWAC